jgi:hypothetical protein
MNLPQVVSPDEWLTARKELLKAEKEVLLARDAVSARRRELPMVKIAAITADKPAVDTSCSFTISIWAKPDASSPTGAVVSQGGARISGFILWYEPSGSTWRFGMPMSDSTGWIGRGP